jgi:hypothetical protein
MPPSPTEIEEGQIEEEFGFTIVEPYTPVELDSISAVSPKRYVGIARQCGFANTEVGTSRTLQKRAPFKSGTRAGEAQPDLEVEHIWLRAWTKGVAYFCIHFTNNRFADAMVWDAVGWPRELWTDYTPSARDLAQAKDEPPKTWKARVDTVKERAKERSFSYNTGEFWTDPNPRSVSLGADFEQWLADMVPGFEPRKRAVSKKKQQVSATAVELLETGEWIG